MIYNNIDSVSYKKIFTKKFENFCNKIATLVSVTTSETGVTVKHENSGKIYRYDWDFDTPVKMFIKKIHDDLINHLPIIFKVVKEELSLTEEEKEAALEAQASAVECGLEPEAIPEKYWHTVENTPYRIEKVIVMKDIFIIRNLDTEQLFRYHMNKSCIHFLANYRKGKYDTPQAAGNVFFETSELLGEITPKGE